MSLFPPCSLVAKEGNTCKYIWWASPLFWTELSRRTNRALLTWNTPYTVIYFHLLPICSTTVCYVICAPTVHSNHKLVTPVYQEFCNAFLIGLHFFCFHTNKCMQIAWAHSVYVCVIHTHCALTQFEVSCTFSSPTIRYIYTTWCSPVQQLYKHLCSVFADIVRNM